MEYQGIHFANETTSKTLYNHPCTMYYRNWGDCVRTQIIRNQTSEGGNYAWLNPMIKNT